MNKLWIFGDSFSEPFSKAKSIPWKAEYIQWKGYMPNCYGEIISDKLKLQHINLAIGGTDNYTILDSIINVLNPIDSADIIIIGWSSTLRFRLVNTNNTFNTILPLRVDNGVKLNKEVFPLELSKSTLEELAVNRDNLIYIDELNNYIKLLNFAFPNNKIIHWSPFLRQEKDGLLNTRSNSISNLNHLERVTEETSGKIDDYHYSENGHIVLAEEFLNIIKNYKIENFKKSIL